MSNPVVKYLSAHIGKPIDSPSHVTSWLNGTLIEIKEGEVKITYVVRDEMLNPAGTLHGGMASLIMDDIIGLSVFTLYNPYFYTSINLAVDFLKTVKLGEEAIAHAEVVRKGRNVVNVKCSIRNKEGKIVARGMSNLIMTQNKNPFYQG